MTISSNIRRAGPFATNGVTVAFPFAFKVFSADDVAVVLTEDGVETTLAAGSDYAAVLNPDQDVSPGGTVTLSTAPNGVELTILSDAATEQPTEFTNLGGFYPSVLNDALDRATILIQQLEERVSRAALLPSGTPPEGQFPVVLPGGNFGFSTGTGNDPALRTDLLSSVSSLGAALVKYRGRGDTPLLLKKKLEETVSPFEFGAAWDGVTNDTAALQAFINYLATNGGYGVLPEGAALITSSLTLPANSVPFTIKGVGDGTIIKMRNTTNSSTSTPLSFIAPTGVLIEDFMLDCGYSVTGVASHGFSFRDARDTVARKIHVKDHRNSAGLMFVSTEDEQWANCHIIDCVSDSGGHGQNGFLLEGMHYSSIQNPTVGPLDLTGSPCIGIQLKNKCRHSYILGGTATGCKAGLAFGGDGATFGDGPHNCAIDAVITKDCLDGGIFGKSTDCWVSYKADMTNSPVPTALEGHALNVAGSNTKLRAEVSIKGVQSGRTAIRVRSSDVSIRVPYASGIGSKLLIMSSGVQRCRLQLDDAADTITDIGSLITDNSGQTNNEVIFLRNLPSGVLTNAAFLRAPVSGSPNNWMSFTNANAAVRVNGVDVLYGNASWVAPGGDNTASAGRATLRYSVVYSVTGTINTSDEREKTDIRRLTAKEIAVAKRCKKLIKSYRWKEAVAAKNDKARVHFGVIAQEVVAAFETEGLDPFAYGVVCYDEWDATEEETDEDGSVVAAARAAGNRYGVRYEELFAFILSAM